MKQKIIGVVAVIVVIGVIVGGFYFFSRGRSDTSENMELTKVQQVITKNLDTGYPATPREVVKFYNRIITCFYNEEYTDEELYALGDQARKLFDEELLDNNPRDAYFTALRADIEDYHERKRVITNSSVCDSNDVEYHKVDGAECAYVTASYFINENKDYSRTYQMYVLRKDENGDWKILVFYQMYVLRKDENGDWKILVFYQIEGDSSDEW